VRAGEQQGPPSLPAAPLNAAAKGHIFCSLDQTPSTQPARAPHGCPALGHSSPAVLPGAPPGAQPEVHSQVHSCYCGNGGELQGMRHRIELTLGCGEGAQSIPQLARIRQLPSSRREWQ
jgi:hypothetical protein